MTGFPRTPRPHEKRWCGTHIGRARRHRCRFRAPARADRRSAFQAVPALLRSRRCAVSLRFAGRCWPVAVKMQPRREPQQSRWRRWQGNADLWPVLPVGAGTAARSAAKGVPPPEHKRDQARERRPLASSAGGRYAPLRVAQRKAYPHPSTSAAWQGNADLWPALPVGLLALHPVRSNGTAPTEQKQWQRTPFAARVSGGKV